MELTPEIRQRLKSAMDSKNETGYTINKKLGISATTIGNYINEDSKVNKADNIKLKAICDLLEIDMEWLEFGQENNLLKRPEDRLAGKDTPEGTTDEIIRQIFLKMSTKDEQFNCLRKEMRLIREEMKNMKEEINKLKTEIHNLKDK